MRRVRRFCCVFVALVVMQLHFAPSTSAVQGQANCQTPQRLTYTGVFVPVGVTFVALHLSVSAIGVGGTVNFHPASGYYRLDSYSVGWDAAGSVRTWYFMYDKVANAGNADFIVNWCL